MLFGHTKTWGLQTKQACAVAEREGGSIIEKNTATFVTAVRTWAVTRADLSCSTCPLIDPACCSYNDNDNDSKETETETASRVEVCTGVKHYIRWLPARRRQT